MVDRLVDDGAAEASRRDRDGDSAAVDVKADARVGGADEQAATTGGGSAPGRVGLPALIERTQAPDHGAAGDHR